MRRVWLSLALLLVGCEACASLHRAEPTPPVALLPINDVYIDPRLFPLLDDALAGGVERIYQVTVIDWDVAANSSVPYDSIGMVRGLLQCPTSGKVDRFTIEHTHCPDPRQPTVHLHPARRDCSPSRADFQTQVRLGHVFDMTYCAPSSGGSAYWLFRNPLFVEHVLTQLATGPTRARR